MESIVIPTHTHVRYIIYKPTIGFSTPLYTPVVISTAPVYCSKFSYPVHTAGWYVFYETHYVSHELKHSMPSSGYYLEILQFSTFSLHLVGSLVNSFKLLQVWVAWTTANSSLFLRSKYFQSVLKLTTCRSIKKQMHFCESRRSFTYTN